VNHIRGKPGGYRGSYSGNQYAGGYRNNQNDNIGVYAIQNRDSHPGFST